MFVFISLFVVGCSSQHNHLTFLAYRIAFVMAQRIADGHFFRVAGLGQSNQQCELEERHHQVEMVNMMLARRLCSGIVLVGFFYIFSDGKNIMSGPKASWQLSGIVHCAINIATGFYGVIILNEYVSYR